MDRPVNGRRGPEKVLGWLDEDEPPPPEQPPIPVRRDPWAAARGGRAHQPARTPTPPPPARTARPSSTPPPPPPARTPTPAAPPTPARPPRSAGRPAWQPGDGWLTPPTVTVHRARRSRLAIVLTGLLAAVVAALVVVVAV